MLFTLSPHGVLIIHGFYVMSGNIPASHRLRLVEFSVIVTAVCHDCGVMSFYKCLSLYSFNIVSINRHYKLSFYQCFYFTGNHITIADELY